MPLKVAPLAVRLALNVCSPVNVFAPKRARVPVVVGNVIVPVFVIVEITGDVNVLFVSVSVVARPTKVSVASGRVMVLSTEGFVTVSVVSKELTPAPSKIILTADCVNSSVYFVPK